MGNTDNRKKIDFFGEIKAEKGSNSTKNIQKRVMGWENQ